MNGFPGDDTGGLQFDSLTRLSNNRALSVDGIAEGVDNSAEEALTNGYIDNGACPLDNISFLDLSIVSQDDNTNVVRLQIERHSAHTTVELHHLTGLDLGETEHTGNTISDGDNSSKFLQVVHLVDAGNFGLQDGHSVADGGLLVAGIGHC